jgi:serine/threonine protein kinase/WD40 repeat protein
VSPLQMVAHYRITAKLGEGGMGEVYRATDTKLGRDVAIKILPEGFAQDPGRMARFTREAQVLASLNHPNIAQIYGVEEGTLVIELVVGQTLEGPLPVHIALEYAKQIAGAIEVAHEKGIIHRDLKPTNIMITPAGMIKVLDFGLATITEESTASGDSSVNPTLTLSRSRTGIMGTPAYMAPEQARGEAVDKRTDIWAFGCVLLEMLTGKPAFRGDSTSDILAAVIKEEPDLETVSPHLRSVIARCLSKDRRTRWRDIGDVRIALEDGLPVGTAPANRRLWLPWAVAGIFAIALIIAGVSRWQDTRRVLHPLMRLSVESALLIDTHSAANVVISPDGTRLVFWSNGPSGKPRLSTHLLSQSQSTVLPGTESAHPNAFFSPNGEWVGFFADTKLKKVPVQGGAPVVICDARNARGASWGDDDNIVFAPDLRGGLVRVSANGGVPRPLTELKAGETSHRWPQVLPGAKVVLFTAGSGMNWDHASIEIQSLTTGQRNALHKGGSYGRFLPSGHLVYVQQSTLFARAFDLDRKEFTGPPAQILEDVANEAVTGSAHFDFSTAPAGHGSLVHRTGKDAKTAIYWLDITGNTQPLYTVPGVYFSPRFSPDGKRLVVALFSGNTGLWMFDSERDNFSRLTSVAGDNYPVWAPDGKHIAYDSARTGLFWVRSDASSMPERLTTSEYASYPYSFSPDGKRLAYAEATPEAGTDIWTLPLEGSESDHPTAAKPEPFLRTAASERDPAFSPDGRWMAYASDESGDFEVYVRPFPGPGSKWRISIAGGRMPVWSKSARELAYETADGRLMTVSYSLNGDKLILGEPHSWPGNRILRSGVQNMDLAPDGKRFAILMAPEASTEQRSPGGVTILLNFFDELRRRVPSDN